MLVPNRSRPLSLIGKKAAAAGTRRANDHNNNKTACLLSPLSHSIILITKQRLIYPVPLRCVVRLGDCCITERELKRHRTSDFLRTRRREARIFIRHAALARSFACLRVMCCCCGGSTAHSLYAVGTARIMNWGCIYLHSLFTFK
jgi:hypothetical protein